jgi:phosphopantothenate---cysteine ligase (CTP)
MNCIVTAGPTYENLDKVRRLTNFSTGRLGVELSSFLANQGHEVTLLVSKVATYSGERRAQCVDTFTSAADLRDQLQSLASQSVSAVFHAAAVSDFMFGKIWVRSAQGALAEVKAGKLSTRQGTLLAELVPTPKLITSLRDWFPKARIVGWKYDVEGARETVVAAAAKQVRECLTDACVANGPAYGEGFGVVGNNGKSTHVPDLTALFAALARMAGG